MDLLVFILCILGMYALVACVELICDAIKNKKDD